MEWVAVVVAVVVVMMVSVLSWDSNEVLGNVNGEATEKAYVNLSSVVAIALT